MPSNPILPSLTPALAQAYDVETFRREGHAMVDALAEILDEAQRRQAPSSYPGHLPQEEREHWKNVLPTMRSWQDVLKETTRRSNLLHDPRYMGHQVAVPLPMQAWVGAWTDLLNNGQAIFEMGPSNAALEDVLMNELGQHLGLPTDCGGILCHGGTLGNLVAMLAAAGANIGGQKVSRVLRLWRFWCPNRHTTAWTALCDSWVGVKRLW
jgi:L-2,4-diaminobutyrate decarboxylase